jgi:hypothetical protein
MVGGLAAQAMDDAAVTLVGEAALQAADLAGAQAQQARGFDLAEGAGEDLVDDLENVALVLAHRKPIVVGSWDRHGSSLTGPRRTFLSGEERTFLFWFDSIQECPLPSLRRVAGS